LNHDTNIMIQNFLDGFRSYYNFVKPHEGLVDWLLQKV